MNSGDGFFWSEIDSMNCRDLAAFLANEIFERIPSSQELNSSPPCRSGTARDSLTLSFEFHATSLFDAHFEFFLVFNILSSLVDPLRHYLIPFLTALHIACPYSRRDHYIFYSFRPSVGWSVGQF